jgi:hypothetical protein
MFIVTASHQGTQLRQERHVLILDQQAVDIPLLTELAEFFGVSCL